MNVEEEEGIKDIGEGEVHHQFQVIEEDEEEEEEEIQKKILE